MYFKVVWAPAPSAPPAPTPHGGSYCVNSKADIRMLIIFDVIQTLWSSAVRRLTLLTPLLYSSTRTPPPPAPQPPAEGERGYGNGLRPSHFYPEHNSKTIQGMLLKLHRVIKNSERKCSVQELCLAYLFNCFPLINFLVRGITPKLSKEFCWNFI